MASEVTFPNSHRCLDIRFAETTKKRVQDADPNGGRCLVTNGECVQYCHCIPRRIVNDERILDSLEWAWNMRFHSLNLDTHYNIFILGINLHGYFGQRQWLLIPEDEILEKYRESLDFVGGQYFAQRERFPDFPERKTFFYKFVPLDLDLGDPILRQDVIPTDGAPKSNEHFSLHFYPFNTLPLLESHLHPKFVIFDAGHKLADSEQNLIQKLVDVFPSLQISSIMALYTAWIRPPPAKAQDDPKYNVPVDNRDSASDDDSYEDEDRTKSGRARRKNKSKATSKLSAHNQEYWTDDRIREWSLA